MSVLWRLVPGILAFGLVGCGDGTDGGSNGGPVYASGDPIIDAGFQSYIGEVFRVSILTGNSGGTQGVATIENGTVEVINANTLDISFSAGETPTRYLRQGSSNFFVNSSGYEIEVDSDGFVQLFFTEPSLVGTVPTILVGNFGFQAPPSLYPSNVATYDQRYASALFIATEGESEIIPIYAGNVSLTVDFSNSSVNATLMEGSRLVDLDNDDALDDELSVLITMDGGLSGDGLTGSISGSAFADIDDDNIDVTDMNLEMGDSSVEGQFLGNAADRITGTYTGEFTFDDPIIGPSSGTAAGYFDAARF